MKNFKTYSAIAAGLMMMIALLLVPMGELKGQSSGIERLIAVTQMKAQAASDQALEGAEEQRELVKQQELLRSRQARFDEQQPQSGRWTARELAREKAVLQQLEANGRRRAEVLESVKRLAAELDRQPGGMDGIKNLVAVTQMKAQTAGNEALKGADDQRRQVNKMQGLRARAVADIDQSDTSESGGLAARDNKQRPQPGVLTSRELAREKAVLKQLEANARRSAEVLDSVKRLAAELARQQRR